jgi:hypothetical protein
MTEPESVIVSFAPSLATENAEPAVALNHLITGIILVIVLLVLGAYFLWRQVRVLGQLRTAGNLSPEDRGYFKRQAWRRLVCSVLMLLFAGLLGMSFPLEEPAQQLVDQGQKAREIGEEKPEMTAEQRQFFDLYSRVWIVNLLVLLAILGLAGADLWAIRRYGLRHYRQIQTDRRAMIEGELARLRSYRNGHS